MGGWNGCETQTGLNHRHRSRRNEPDGLVFLVVFVVLVV